MNIKVLLDEALNRGEKIKHDVIKELQKSKTIKEVVSSKHFITALSRMIETKQEIQRAISKQVHTIFNMMDVPTQKEIKKIGKQLSKLESVIDQIGRRKISISSLPKNKTKKKSSKKKVSSKKKSSAKKKSAGKKTSHRIAKKK